MYQPLQLVFLFSFVWTGRSSPSQLLVRRMVVSLLPIQYHPILFFSKCTTVFFPTKNSIKIHILSIPSDSERRCHQFCSSEHSLLLLYQQGKIRHLSVNFWIKFKKRTDTAFASSKARSDSNTSDGRSSCIELKRLLTLTDGKINYLSFTLL